MARAPLDFKTNFGTLAEDIGMFIGMSEGVDQKEYVGGLMKGSYSKTVPDWLKYAAATAKAGNFSHMYEWGVRGINRGDGSLINPISQSARLWKDEMVGTGSRRLITFVFRDAVKKNPKHTTESTGGVAQEELDKLKINQGTRYVFQRKAEVFEQGEDVNIFPKQREGRLFVPLHGTSIRVSEKDAARGFTWAKALHINPGEQSGATGQFSFHFFSWWSEKGNVLMVKRMDETVTKHIRALETEMGKGGTMKPAAATNIAADSEKGRKKARKQFTIWAREEENTKQVII